MRVHQLDFAVDQCQRRPPAGGDRHVEFGAANGPTHDRSAQLDFLRLVAAEEVGRARFQIEHWFAAHGTGRLNLILHQFADSQHAQVGKAQQRAAFGAGSQLIANLQSLTRFRRHPVGGALGEYLDMALDGDNDCRRSAGLAGGGARSR